MKKVKDKQLDETVDAIIDYKPTVGSSSGINSMVDAKTVVDDDDEDEVIINNENMPAVIEEKNENEGDEVIDEDSDNPPAGTPGHPGFDEDAE